MTQEQSQHLDFLDLMINESADPVVYARCVVERAKLLDEVLEQALIWSPLC